MRSLNTIIRFQFLLLINIICVICPTLGDLQRCEDDLYREFRNDEPLDDLIHGFLNVEYDSVNWIAETDTNETFFRGNGILTKSAKTYYYDLYNTAQEMGIPELLTPDEYCSEKHVNYEDECINAIAEIGCGPNQRGYDCFERMYFRWRKKVVNVTPVYGTSHLSDVELLEAISRGSTEFRYLPDRLLFKAFEAHADELYELSDKMLLQNYYRSIYDGRIRRSNHTNVDDYYADIAFTEYIEMNYRNIDADELNDEFGYYGRDRFDERNLLQAREKAYGISYLPYSSIVEEYKRRKKEQIEELQRCKDYEPLDNLLHGLLNIKYDSVNWNEETDANENYFRGNDTLKISARTYYYDLYNTAQEMEEKCLSAIAEIGCGANHSGLDCFERMYFHWKKKTKSSREINSTRNLTDEQLLEDLSDEELFEAFVERSDIIDKLSDENLLRVFYKTRNEAHSSSSR